MAAHMVSFLGKNEDPDVLVISFEGKFDRSIAETVKADYNINGHHRQIGPYKVLEGEEVIYARN